MRRADYYTGLTLAEALRALADHHGAPRTRHINADKTALLYRAAVRLEHVTTVTVGDSATGRDLAQVTPLRRRAVDS